MSNHPLLQISYLLIVELLKVNLLLLSSQVWNFTSHSGGSSDGSVSRGGPDTDDGSGGGPDGGDTGSGGVVVVLVVMVVIVVMTVTVVVVM